jgi:hypothetical protein
MYRGACRQRLFVSWRWVVLLIPVVACGGVPAAGTSIGMSPGRLLVVDDLQRTNGLTALDVLTRSMLIEVASDAVDGTSARCPRRYRRVAEPAVFVDEQRAEPQILHSLPASEIASFRIICTNDAMLRYGRVASGGAILITLRK